MNPIIDKPNHMIEDTTPLIFDHVFMVRVPAIATYDEDIVREVGVRSTNFEEYDKELMNEYTTVMLTIDKMVELHRKGYTIRVVDPDDVERIYDNISKHLNAWKYHLEHSMHIRNAPIDDLVILDEFATTIFHNAKHILTREQIDDILASQILKFNPIILTQDNEPIMDNDPQREGLKDFFEEKSTKINNGRFDTSLL